MKIYIGIEFGSTRIKAVAIDESYKIISQGEYTWKSSYADGMWTYSLEEAVKGLNVALKKLVEKIDVGSVASLGISGMMHGYLAFDKDWKLLAPFATWQNTVTGQAAQILTEKFDFNVPQRWSVCHFYQRILNGEAHVKEVAHLTTLAGYIHFLLTGENVVGIGEASGMFPIDGQTKTYDAHMAATFNALTKERGIDKDILDLLPSVKVAGQCAGELNNTALIGDLLKKGIKFAPPEGDMQTGMVATNSIGNGTGNISAGTAFNLTIVTGKELNKVYPEIDIIKTPVGDTAALIHINNGTNDINAWFSILKETAELFGGNTEELYTKLFEHSLNGDADCGGVLVFNYMAGEPIAHVDEGKPVVVRAPGAHFDLANFVRAQLYGSMATMRMGLDIISDENIELKRITGHGGFFKTAHVAQKYMAAACNAPIYCNSAAGEGGPFGMALLTAYRGMNRPLNEFLDGVFEHSESSVVDADKMTEEGFDKYMDNFRRRLKMQEV